MKNQIIKISENVLAIYQQQRTALEKFSNEQLADLIHQCGENEFSQDYSVRVAAEVNRTAAEAIIESRKK